MGESIVAREGNALAEPALARFLRVVRHELIASIGNELNSERARGILDLVSHTLDHLIVREEMLEKLLAPFVKVEQTTLRQLTRGEPPRAASHSAAHMQAAAQIERLIEQTPALAEEPYQKTWLAIRDVIRSESDFHGAIEACERLVASTAAVQNEAEAIQLQKTRFESYLNSRFAAAGSIRVAEIFAPIGGLSKDTLIVKLSGIGRPADAVVIRRDVAHGPLEGVVAAEFEILKAMRASGVPVAEPLWVENDGQVFGGPFIVTSCVKGKPLVDVKLEVTGEGARECTRQLAQVLARIHSVDPRAAQVPEAEMKRSVQDHVLQELDRYEQQWRRRRLGPSSVVSAGFAWMKRNLPGNLSQLRIVHGDAQLRNMLFADNQVTAMLDWETWHLGDPGEDIAYARMDAERSMPWSEFLAEYHAHGGVPFSAESERFWGMWMFLRGAVSSISMMDRLLYDPPADIRPAFAGPHYTRFCIRKVADYLLEH